MSVGPSLGGPVEKGLTGQMYYCFDFIFSIVWAGRHGTMDHRAKPITE